MASKIERVAGRALAITAGVGLLTLQGYFHPHRRFRHRPPGHVKHGMKHRQNHGKEVMRAVPRPAGPRR